MEIARIKEKNSLHTFKDSTKIRQGRCHRNPREIQMLVGFKYPVPPDLKETLRHHHSREESQCFKKGNRIFASIYACGFKDHRQ